MVSRPFGVCRLFGGFALTGGLAVFAHINRQAVHMFDRTAPDAALVTEIDASAAGQRDHCRKHSRRESRPDLRCENFFTGIKSDR